MKFKLAALIFSLFAGTSSLAQNQNFKELSLIPLVGYSSLQGFVIGFEGSLSLMVTEQVQFESGGLIYSRGDRTPEWASGVFMGPVYNFGDDIARAFYVGGGIGLSSVYPFINTLDPEEKLAYGYLKVGKRFVINDAGTIIYKPQLSYKSIGEHRPQLISIDVLQFSWSF
jgi:hypothetical protein